MIKIYHKQSIPSHDLVREYSKEVHGEDYKELAKAYAERYAYNVDRVEDTEEENKAIDTAESPSVEVEDIAPKKGKKKSIAE